MSMRESHFGERSGLVYFNTPWGRWSQTLEEIQIEVSSKDLLKSKNIQVDVKPKTIHVKIFDDIILEVRTFRLKNFLQKIFF